MLEFQKVVREAELLPPPEFQLETQSIEFRTDPLISTRTRINVQRTGRLTEAKKVDLSDYINKTREDCLFCPENIEKTTPLFVKDIWEEGRIKNRCYVLFPNRYPFGEYHAVGTLTDKHFLDLDEFPLEPIVDNLLACKEYVLTVYKKKGARYPTWIWNHLPPSAASQVHPHTQIWIDTEPTNWTGALIKKSKEYFDKNKRSYWEDLVEKEKDRERWVGENDSLAIIATFAPHGNREIQFIFKEASNLAELSERQANDLVDCVLKTLKWYKEEGMNSFNLSTFSAGVDEKLNYYRLNVKMMSKPVFQPDYPYYTAYGGTVELWHGEYVVDTLPENVAQKLKHIFR